MGTAITSYEGSTAISQWKEPDQVLAEAKKAAVALKQVMDSKPNKVMFNNEQYLEREDWGTVARFYNCTAKSIETRFVQYGDVSGWEAVAVVIDMRTMNEIGRAESMCLSDEENWGDVPYYEWEDVLDENGKKIWDQNLRNGKGGYKSRKVQKGSKPKPLFQLRSMAQTRAEAKALKGVFSWVVVLAGYKPTPAEELTGHEDFDQSGGREQKPPVQQPQRASDKGKTPPPPAAQKTESKPQAEQTASGNASNLPAGQEIISGVIKSSADKNGILRLDVDDKIVLVKEAEIDGDMRPGYFIKLRGEKQHSDKVGTFYVLRGLIELAKEGEVLPADNKKMDPENAALADELFGEKPKEGTAAVQEMIDKGQVTTAANLPQDSGKKPGTIGKKRAIRLDALCNSHKDKNNGFNHDEMKRILSAMPVPVEHLADMETGMYEEFEAWATGAKDWREFWKD